LETGVVDEKVSSFNDRDWSSTVRFYYQRTEKISKDKWNEIYLRATEYFQQGGWDDTDGEGGAIKDGDDDTLDEMVMSDVE